jgi:hypothetical protein
MATPAVVAIMLTAVPAGAAQVVTFGFTGTVDVLDQDRGLFGAPGSVAVGDPFSGHFSYQIGPGNPDQAPGDAAVGRYALTAFVVDGGTAPLGTMSIVVQLVEPVPAPVPEPPIPGSDRLTVVVESPVYARGIQFRLWAPYQTVFADDALPTDLDLGAFTEFAVLAGLGPGALLPQQPRNDIGTITSLFLIGSVAVPAPGGLPLVGLGLAALAWRRRRPALAPRPGGPAR